MDLLETVIIAIVEGLTEFLPVSSTGHMIITQSLLGVESTPFVKAFTVIIQFGAILSVICLYWKRFFYPNAGREGKSYWRAMFDFYARLVVGVLPAAVLGFAFNDETMATIVGGMSQKLTRKAAAEFSFFLAVPTMFGATCLETYKLISHGDGSILAQGNNLQMLIIGSVVAFIVAILAIKFFINYVSKYGFAAFGWYRIIVGLIIIICSLCGIEMKMTD